MSDIYNSGWYPFNQHDAILQSSDLEWKSTMSPTAPRDLLSASQFLVATSVESSSWQVVVTVTLNMLCLLSGRLWLSVYWVSVAGARALLHCMLTLQQRQPAPLRCQKPGRKAQALLRLVQDRKTWQKGRHVSSVVTSLELLSFPQPLSHLVAWSNLPLKTDSPSPVTDHHVSESGKAKEHQTSNTYRVQHGLLWWSADPKNEAQQNDRSCWGSLSPGQESPAFAEGSVKLCQCCIIFVCAREREREKKTEMNAVEESVFPRVQRLTFSSVVQNGPKYR